VIRLNLLATHEPKQNTPARIVLQRSATRFNAAMTLLVAALFFFDLLLTRKVQLDGLSQLSSGWPTFLFVVAGLCLCHWRPLPRLIHSCENAIWAVLLTHLLSVVIQIAARSPFPLVDAQLTYIDRCLHLNTARIAGLSAHIPMLRSIFAATYNLVSLLIMLALILPPFTGRPEASQRYIVALVIGTLITATLFALWPAAGPWMTEGFAPSPIQLQVTKYLLLLKSPARVTLNFNSAAIVSFPSFHVVLALLSAMSLGAIPRVRPLVWSFAGITCLSTLTTGWHYGIDLLGGLAVAVTAQLGAAWVCPYLEESGKDSLSARESKILANTPRRFKRAA
jgi:hypothetical protein